MSENPYQAPLTSIDDEKSSPIISKPGPILITITILLVVINLFLSFIVVSSIQGVGGSYSTGYSIGYIVGRTFFVPIIIVALFQAGKRFRNKRSQTKIFMWSSVVVLLSLLGNIGSTAQEQI